jgi:hypothetical protein
MFFNTIFTLLPTVLVGIFDQDLTSSTSLRTPQIYLRGIRQEMFSNERLWIYIFHGIWQSLMCYFGVYLFVNDNAFYGGHGYDLSVISTLMSFSIILVINVFGTTNWYSWTWINFFSFGLSMTLWIVYLCIYFSTPGTLVYGTLSIVFTTPAFYAIFIVVCVLCLIPRVTIKYIQIQLSPNDTDLLQEYQKYTSARVSSEEELDEAGGTSGHSSQGNSNISRNSYGVEQTDGFDTSSHKRAQSISSALQSGMSKLLKNFLPDKQERAQKPITQRKGSIVYMADPRRENILNTGFAFSQDQGMRDIITPSQVSLEEIDYNVKHAQAPLFSFPGLFGFGTGLGKPNTPAAKETLAAPMSIARPSSPIKLSIPKPKLIRDIDDEGEVVVTSISNARFSPTISSSKLGPIPKSPDSSALQ